MKSWLNVLVLGFIQVHDIFNPFLIVLEMSPEQSRGPALRCGKYMNLDICSLIVPTPEINYGLFCHSRERWHQTGQTRHVAALGMSGQRHRPVTLRDFQYSRYNPDVSWVTVKWEEQLTRQISPFTTHSQLKMWLSKRDVFEKYT